MWSELDIAWYDAYDCIGKDMVIIRRWACGLVQGRMMHRPSPLPSKCLGRLEAGEDM